ncbi:hypothetical protein BUQ74_15135 [Leptospira weilii serovar Heyan]|nr:hypothetical protein BUQ74_15135 [Leptospira weilii serovar Heyan]
MARDRAFRFNSFGIELNVAAYGRNIIQSLSHLLYRTHVILLLSRRTKSFETRILAQTQRKIKIRYF